MEITLDKALAKGIEAHKAGKFQEAERYYTAILKANPKHTDANHNMGVLAVAVSKVQEALPFFKTALEANPKIAQFWLSYVYALIKLNRLADAKKVLDQAKSQGLNSEGIDQVEKQLGSSPSKKSNILAPTHEQLHILGNLYTRGQYQEALSKGSQLLEQFPNSINLYNIIGAANQGLGRIEEAIEAYNTAISIMPDNADAYNNMGVALKEQGKLKEATEAYAKAISIKPYYAEAYNNMGYTLQLQGNIEKAIELYSKAISLKPRYSDAHYNLGIAFKEQGKLKEAIEAYAKAITIKPDNALAYNNIGNALAEQGRLKEAIEAYTKALSIKPNNVEAWSNGANALEKWNRLDQLEIWLDEALNSFEKVPADLLFMKCKLLWRYKKYEQTSKLLKDIKFKSISESRKQDYLQFKAKYFEKFQKFDDAYACFTQSNLLAKESNEYLKHDPDQYFQDLRDSLGKLKLISKTISKTNSGENPEFSPTFLVGFPRSGTTLLDTILRSNSKINVVEEQGMLSAANNFLKTNGIDNFSLQSIPNKLLSEAREIYKRDFKKFINASLSGSACVDKLPLNLLEAPLINQLYPNAKFILALRHPMDTILSCWMQKFKLNSAMANMVDLDRTVDFYCIAMETFKLCRKSYNLNVHEIRYENLINDFRKESEAVVRFLNLQWEPEMENYRDTAIKRGRINTPSYSQVIQPIYKDSQYRWLNYQKYLEQYLEQVKPWILEFGYD